MASIRAVSLSASKSRSDRPDLSPIEAHAVNGVNDEWHTSLTRRETTNDSCLAAVGMHHIGLKFLESSAQCSNCLPVAERSNGSNQLRELLIAVSSATGSINQRALWPACRPREEKYFVPPGRQSLASENGVFLRPADDQPRNDVNDSHFLRRGWLLRLRLFAQVYVGRQRRVAPSIIFDRRPLDADRRRCCGRPGQDSRTRRGQACQAVLTPTEAHAPGGSGRPGSGAILRQQDLCRLTCRPLPPADFHQCADHVPHLFVQESGALNVHAKFIQMAIQVDASNRPHVGLPHISDRCERTEVVRADPGFCRLPHRSDMER